MKIIADLQIHSPYARAVSKNMSIENIALWASKKGIDLVTPGDWTHPVRYKEIRDQLLENSEGIYELKSKIKKSASQRGQNAKLDGVRFLLVTEVSCVFRQNGKYHGIHILVFAPNLEIVEKINKALKDNDQNLLSDGRPILNLNCRDLAALILDVDERCLLIPAHSWTPWFGFYGAHGGFDSIDQAFGKYAKYIYAVETGLGSDPTMNWRIKELDNRNIVSFSDAHSLQKIGREVTAFEAPELSYGTIGEAIVGPVGNSSRPMSSVDKLPAGTRRDALRSRHPQSAISYTIEFYRQEGKYHATGHRKCGVVFLPEETPKDFVCPVCGKKLTVGAAQRTEDLAFRNEKCQMINDKLGVRWVTDPEGKRPPFVNLVPLQEILSEVYKVGVQSKKVQTEYERLVTNFAPEFEILLTKSLKEIGEIGGEKLKEAMGKVRGGDVQVIPGFDGQFGVVKIWDKRKIVAQTKQLGLL